MTPEPASPEVSPTRCPAGRSVSMRAPCSRCHVVHADTARAIVVHDPDDEVVACGFAHLERTTARSAYLGLHAADGTWIMVWLFATKRGKLRMSVEEAMEPEKGA